MAFEKGCTSFKKILLGKDHINMLFLAGYTTMNN